MEKDKLVTSYTNSLTRGKGFLFGNRKRTILTITSILGIIVISYYLFGQRKKAVSYQTVQVQKGTIIATVSESGNIASGNHANVGSPTTGIIEELYVKDGDIVTQGQNLFKVKSIATAQEIAQAYSAYQSALAAENAASQNKITSQATLEKDREAVITASQAVTTMQNNINTSQVNPATKQAYTQNDIDAINSTLTSSRETFSADEQKYLQSGQSIGAATAAANSALLSYQATQDSVVTAPISGAIANIAVRAGDQITASAGNLTSNQSSSTTTSSNTSVLSIGNSSNPYIKVQASEVDAPSIQTGQKVTITLSAFPSKTFVGTVDQVDSVGTVTSGVVTYNVFITFVSPPQTILPGMTASVVIQTARKDNVLTVPSSAISTVNGQQTVRVLNSGKISSVDVATGITSDTDTEITSGLSENDTVVTSVQSSSQSSSPGTSPFGGSVRGFGGGFGGGGGGGARGGGRGG